jgi:hypothetical protein
MHEEMPDHRDGRLAGFQLWVNLPAKDKMMAPRYQDMPAEDIPEIEHENGVRVRVITGTVDGVQGPVKDIVADPIYLDVRMPSDTAFHQSVTRGHTVFAYVFEGGGAMGEKQAGQRGRVSAPQLIVFGDGDAVQARTADTPMRFLLVSGAPINEPIARYGPFVMNTQEEIRQTLKELREGTFVPGM